MSWNQALETGGLVIGKKVKLELEVEAVKGGGVVTSVGYEAPSGPGMSAFE
jgi:hypothetical protein